MESLSLNEAILKLEGLLNSENSEAVLKLIKNQKSSDKILEKCTKQ